jgi:hypothetical protein
MKTPILYRLLRLNPANNDDRNAFHLVIEVFFAAVLAAAASFNGAYAIRLGASNEEIGLLSSLPALIAVAISIPVGRFLQGRARHKPWIAGSLMIHRSGYLLVALVPLLKLAGINQGSLAVALLITISAPAHFFNVGWTPMLADVVPEEHRAAVFSARNIAANATTSVCVFLFGQWLSRMPFPGNYQIMYVFGFLVALLSQYFILKVNMPEKTPLPKTTLPAQPAGSKLKAQVAGFFKALHDEPNFQRLTLNTGLDYGWSPRCISCITSANCTPPMPGWVCRAWC